MQSIQIRYDRAFEKPSEDFELYVLPMQGGVGERRERLQLYQGASDELLSEHLGRIRQLFGAPESTSKYSLRLEGSEVFGSNDETLQAFLERSGGDGRSVVVFSVHMQLQAQRCIEVLSSKSAPKVKDAVFQLQHLLKDAAFATPFIGLKGLSDVLEVLSSSRGNVQGYALAALRSALAYVSAVQYLLSDEDEIRTLVALLASTVTSVPRQVLELLFVLCKFGGENACLRVDRAIRAAATADAPPYTSVHALLDSGDVDTLINALTLLNTLLQGVLPAKRKALLAEWAGTLGLMAKVAALAPAADESLVIQQRLLLSTAGVSSSSFSSSSSSSSTLSRRTGSTVSTTTLDTGTPSAGTTMSLSAAAVVVDSAAEKEEDSGFARVQRAGTMKTMKRAALAEPGGSALKRMVTVPPVRGYDGLGPEEKLRVLEQQQPWVQILRMEVHRQAQAIREALQLGSSINANAPLRRLTDQTSLKPFAMDPPPLPSEPLSSSPKITRVSSSDEKNERNKRTEMEPPPSLEEPTGEAVATSSSASSSLRKGMEGEVERLRAEVGRLEAEVRRRTIAEHAPSYVKEELQTLRARVEELGRSKRVIEENLELLKRMPPPPPVSPPEPDRETVAQLKAELEAAQWRATESREQISVLQSELAKSRDRAAQMASSQETMRLSSAAVASPLDGSSGAGQGGSADHGDEVARLGKENTTLRVRILELQMKQRSIKSAADSESAVARQLQAQVARLDEERKAAEVDRDKLATQLRSIMKVMRVLKDKCESQAVFVDQVEAAKNTLADQLEASLGSVRDLTILRDLTLEECTSLKEECTSLREQCTSLREECTSLREECASLRSSTISTVNVPSSVMTVDGESSELKLHLDDSSIESSLKDSSELKLMNMEFQPLHENDEKVENDENDEKVENDENDENDDKKKEKEEKKDTNILDEEESLGKSSSEIHVQSKPAPMEELDLMAELSALEEVANWMDREDEQPVEPPPTLSTSTPPSSPPSSLPSSHPSLLTMSSSQPLYSNAAAEKEEEGKEIIEQKEEGTENEEKGLPSHERTLSCEKSESERALEQRVREMEKALRGRDVDQWKLQREYELRAERLDLQDCEIRELKARLALAAEQEELSQHAMGALNEEIDILRRQAAAAKVEGDEVVLLRARVQALEKEKDKILGSMRRDLRIIQRQSVSLGSGPLSLPALMAESGGGNPSSGEEEGDEDPEGAGKKRVARSPVGDMDLRMMRLGGGSSSPLRVRRGTSSAPLAPSSQRQPRYSPPGPMLAFYWSRLVLLPEHVASQEKRYMWDALPSVELDEDGLVKYFALSSSSSTSSSTSTSSTSSMSTAESAMMEPSSPALSISRQHSLAQFVRSTGLGVTDLVTAIRDLDEEVLGQVPLRSLVQSVPTAQEIQAVVDLHSKKQANQEEMPPPSSREEEDDARLSEQFVLGVAQIGSLQERVQVWAVKHSFGENVETLGRSVRAASEGIRVAHDGDCVRLMLAAVLAFGNYLNAQTSRGAADGFQVEDLRLLNSVGSVRKASMTAAYFVMRMVCAQMPDFGERAGREAASLREGARTSFVALRRQMEALAKDLTKTQLLLDQVADTDALHRSLTEFLHSAPLALRSLRAEFLACSDAFSELVLFYGYPPSRVPDIDLPSFLSALADALHAVLLHVPRTLPDSAANLRTVFQDPSSPSSQSMTNVIAAMRSGHLQ